ncbi:Protein of unknown function [Oceanospirillum multiglobuliferum]|uniref:Zinc-binding protein n=1 Tax=Oceanospirillum multiglobuliferum TaxID=64969 RepID=A0A1T4RRV6_9GAMM|nr:DUF2796 domain-containing protein [Oceanospirillum multiglobuliferum]OPX54710.1 hypothetical protein BTE48_13095 [Oceanospirillum multiglobuliferum]SKA18745.1 Protein of unknown function [Oceanospirillum multiglobuliferum]
MTVFRFSPVLIGAVALSSSLYTQSSLASEYAAHEHGVIHLKLAQEGHQVSVELSGAADGFLGFEHSPKTEAEHEQLDKLIGLLKQPEQLFAFAKNCQLDDKVLSIPFKDDDHDADHAHEKDHAHEDDHAHEKDHAHAESSHNDIAANYTFDCKSGQASPFSVKMFNLLPHLEHLRIEAVSDRSVFVGEREANGTFTW